MRAQLEALLDKGPVYLMSETPAAAACCRASRATLLYSEFPLARFGYGQAGADYIAAIRLSPPATDFLKLLPLYWYTLYRVERSATIRS